MSFPCVLQVGQTFPKHFWLGFGLDGIYLGLAQLGDGYRVF